MIKKSLLINKDWNLSLILIPILLSFFISLYVLLDVDKSTETLGFFYEVASLKLENVYELGAFGVIVFLVNKIMLLNLLLMQELKRLMINIYLKNHLLKENVLLLQMDIMNGKI